MSFTCADCVLGSCDDDNKAFPKNCLSNTIEKSMIEKSKKAYEDENEHKMFEAAAQIEYEFYCKLTRVEEIIEFCKRMGYKKIGIASCVGVRRETNVFSKILKNHGFEVYGVVCKSGMVRKTEVGLDKELEDIGEHICNPILQALLLEKEETDFNIVIGLCVGHDSLFYKHSKAPVTTLFTKDRVLAHNAAAALYQADAYYSRLMQKDKFIPA